MHPHHHHHPHHAFHSPRGMHHDGGEGGRGHGREHGHGGPQHGPGAERHRRERMFEAGGLKLIALHLIAQQPSHGYDVIRAIYPTLSYLVDMGHATATEVEGGRKRYAVTPEGQAALQEQDGALQQLLARLAHGKDREARQRPAGLVRAVENFKTALRLKTHGQPGVPAAPLTDAQVAAIAAILDEAALKIEKA